MIVEVARDAAALKEFLALPRRVYGDDPHYVAEPTAKTKQTLSRRAFVDRQRVTLCYKHGKPVGRVVARLAADTNSHESANKQEAAVPLGMLGFFEAMDTVEPVVAMLTDAVQWLAQQGARRIVGPMDGDTWHRYRLNVGPTDRPPFLMEPYNPPYYEQLWQQAGFQPLESYYSMFVDPIPAGKALAESHQRASDAGYRFRPIDLARFESELEIIYQVSTTVFADNLLYSEISLHDFCDLYRPAKAIIDPELVMFAESPSGEPVGFVFSFVDYHRAMAAMRGQSGLLAKLRFLLNRGKADAVNIKSLGVLPDHRRAGLAGALMHESYRAIQRKGFRQANLCLIREGNPSGRLDGGFGEVSRRYVLYEHQDYPA